MSKIKPLFASLSALVLMVSPVSASAQVNPPPPPPPPEFSDDVITVCSDGICEVLLCTGGVCVVLWTYPSLLPPPL